MAGVKRIMNCVGVKIGHDEGGKGLGEKGQGVIRIPFILEGSGRGYGKGKGRRK